MAKQLRLRQYLHARGRERYRRLARNHHRLRLSRPEQGAIRRQAGDAVRRKTAAYRRYRLLDRRHAARKAWQGSVTRGERHCWVQEQTRISAPTLQAAIATNQFPDANQPT